MIHHKKKVGKPCQISTITSIIFNAPCAAAGVLPALRARPDRRGPRGRRVRRAYRAFPVAKIVSADNREWEGSPTELALAIQTDMAVNRLTKHLNVNASRLLEEHQVKYENKTKHAGRRIRLTYMVVEAPAFEVIE